MYLNQIGTSSFTFGLKCIDTEYFYDILKEYSSVHEFHTFFLKFLLKLFLKDQIRITKEKKPISLDSVLIFINAKI